MATEGTSLLDPPPTITIETDRLILTTLQMSDLDGLMPIISSPEVMKWTTTGPITSRPDAERWLSTRALGPGVFQFSVRLRSASNNTTPAQEPCPIIGILGSFHRPKSGYLFHPGYHGQGYATEAFQAFTRAYFQHVPSPRASADSTITTSDAAAPTTPNPNPDVGAYDYLEAWTDVTNAASQRVLVKCGFRHLRVYENDIEMPILGLRSSSVFRIARPGCTLEEVGAATMDGDDDNADRVVPPIQ